MRVITCQEEPEKEVQAVYVIHPVDSGSSKSEGNKRFNTAADIRVARISFSLINRA
jgi:hypothetical protein